MIIARSSRKLPLILGLLSAALAIAVLVVPETAPGSRRWICVLFASGAAFFLYFAVKPPIVLQVRDGRVRAFGLDCPVSEIKAAKVLGFSTTTGKARCLQVEFRGAPQLSSFRQALNRLARIGIPKHDSDGNALGKDSVVMLGIPKADIPDAELNLLIADALIANKAALADRSPGWC